jgi:starch phosphorylase
MAGGPRPTTPRAGGRSPRRRGATALLNLLEHEVIPLFYERDGEGLPRRWLARMKSSLHRFVPRFSGERMLRDYLATVYAPPPS